MRETILDEIRRMTAANKGKPPGSGAFERQSGFRETDWRGKYWARWGDALTEAGFAPNQKQERFTPEYVLGKYIEACRHYRSLATSSELRMYRRANADFPNEASIHSHFGSKDELVTQLATFVEGKPEYDDIVKLLSPRAVNNTDVRSSDGYVYLIKSGQHYKIGRSDEIERRVKEIRIALPEAANLVHTIRTDDPAGIEAYWHNRFSDRRANGEWFRLSNSDVQAFKRRKYQ